VQKKPVKKAKKDSESEDDDFDEEEDVDELKQDAKKFLKAGKAR